MFGFFEGRFFDRRKSVVMVHKQSVWRSSCAERSPELKELSADSGDVPAEFAVVVDLSHLDLSADCAF